jgi:hypothetical protein
MALDTSFIALGRDAVRRNAAEIGMHLHAWHSPPEAPVSEADYAYCPYLIEYPESVMRAKIDFLTTLLRDTFDVDITSHRAGRWAFDGRYARLLIEQGYRVDCSVTPGVSWHHCPGAPGGVGGTDYTRFPDHAYWLDPAAIARPGTSELLELPMTILSSRLDAVAPWVYRLGTLGRVINRIEPQRRWLRPNGHNLRAMLGVVDQALAEQRPYIEFVLHSSELMPSGSPSFPTPSHIERLYVHLDRLFRHISHQFRGLTLGDYATELSNPSSTH